jgi:ketosteroid isomerase-like protein
MQPTIASDLDILRDLNRDYIRSVQNSDVHRFDEILADDFVCTNADGSLVDRAGFLRQTARPAAISNLDAHDVNVRIMGDFAIIHARTTCTRPDGVAGAGCWLPRLAVSYRYRVGQLIVRHMCADGLASKPSPSSG